MASHDAGAYPHHQWDNPEDHPACRCYSLLECPFGCGRSFFKMDLAEHLSTVCKYRHDCCCPGCNKEELCNHPDSTHQELAGPPESSTCQYCKLEDPQNGHLELCRSTPLPCAMKDLGCDFVGLPFTRLQHEEDLGLHLRTIHGSLQKQMKESNERHNWNLAKEASSLKKVQSTHLDKIESLEKRLTEFWQEFEALKTKVLGMDFILAKFLQSQEEVAKPKSRYHHLPPEKPKLIEVPKNCNTKPQTEARNEDTDDNNGSQNRWILPGWSPNKVAKPQKSVIYGPLSNSFPKVKLDLTLGMQQMLSGVTIFQLQTCINQILYRDLGQESEEKIESVYLGHISLNSEERNQENINSKWYKISYCMTTVPKLKTLDFRFIFKDKKQEYHSRYAYAILVLDLRNKTLFCSTEAFEEKCHFWIDKLDPSAYQETGVWLLLCHPHGENGHSYINKEY